MNYDYLDRLKKIHPAWKLLTADSAPLVISFLERVFIGQNIRSIKESSLEEKLEDYLTHIRSIHGDNSYPREADDYLDDWSEGTHGWVRKYYPRLGDEAEYDITPAAEKTIEWLRSFEKREFIGTESRLLLIFQMVRDLVGATETDPQKRIDELEKRKAEIDDEIIRVKEGLVTSYDSRQIKENFWRIDEEIRRLMLDFREVEENFRFLDRQTRERIATGTLAKSQILDKIFSEHDAIEQSEQGKSFAAFWYFLMSQNRQEELEKNTEKILKLDCINEGSPSSALASMRYTLLDAGDKVKRTLGNLNEQLRTFLDEKLWLENRRIMDLIKSVEEKAIALRQSHPAEKNFSFLDSINPDIELPMERKLFTSPEKPPVLEDTPEEGQAETPPDILYSQHYVDEARLKDNIRRALSEKSQISLKDICDSFPVEKGLSEIITYAVIASRDKSSIIDTSAQQIIEYNDNGRLRAVSLPLIIFCP